MSNAVHPCFAHYIGVRGSCAISPPPTSGLYINDLEGINLQNAALIAGSETPTGAALLQEKIIMGINRLADDFKAALLRAGSFRFNAELASVQEGAFSSQYLSPTSAQRGLRIKANKRGRFARVFVKSLRLLANTTQSGVTITLTDGPFTQNYSIDVVAGEPTTIAIHYWAHTDMVSITIDNTTLAVNDSRIQTPVARSGCGCGGSKDAAPLTVNGWDGAMLTDCTYGLEVTANITCDEWALLCALSHRLGYPALYAAGIEVAKERLHTNRLNALTLNTEEATTLLQRWQKEYQQRLEQLIHEIPTLLAYFHDACITCRMGHSTHLLP